MSRSTILVDPSLIIYLIRIAKQDGIEFIVGYENEFTFLLSADPVKPGNIHQYTDARGLIPSLREAQCLEDIVNSLVESGIDVETWHCEAGPGQVSSILLQEKHPGLKFFHSSTRYQQGPLVLWRPLMPSSTRAKPSSTLLLSMVYTLLSPHALACLPLAAPRICTYPCIKPGMKNLGMTFLILNLPSLLGLWMS